MIVQRGGRKTSDERVIALFLMYCTITNKISLADAARISQNQAAAARLQQQATLLSRPTKPLPANFRYDANKVCFICSITFLDLISQRRLLFFLLSAFRLPTLTVRLVYATGLSCLSSNPTNCDARRMPTTPSFRGGWICLIIAGLERSPVESSIHSSSTHARARRWEITYNPPLMQVRYQAKGWIHMPIHSLSRCWNTLCIIIWNWEALNHGSITSDRSGPTPQITKKNHPHFRWVTRAKDGSTYPYTAYLGAETPFIHIWYGFGKHYKWGLRLSLGSTTSDRVGPSPQVTKNPPLIYYVGYQAKVGSI